MKETLFRPPQPCPPPARTLPLPLGLPTAPVPAAPSAAHSNLLRNGHVFREHRCPRGELPRSLGRGRKSRSCRTSSQAATRAAPEARGRGTAEAAWRGTRGRGMWRRPRARSSRAGRGFRRVPARGLARLGVAAHPGHVLLSNSLWRVSHTLWLACPAEPVPSLGGSQLSVTPLH